MKILFVSAEPIRSRQASATHINEVVRGLESAGHEVTICATPIAGPYERTALSRRCVAYLVFWFQALWQLHHATLVYARAHFVNFPIAVIARLRHIPIVHEINGSYNDVSITHSWLSPFTGLIRSLYRFQYRTANALITVTPDLADWVRNEVLVTPIFVIPNGANCAVFFPERTPVRFVERDYALFFGSLTRWHGIETMIAAVEDGAWPADLDLVIVGEGQLGAMVQQASAQNARIHALASVPQEILAGYVTGAVVGLVPINTVGGRGKFGLSPLKLFEMLACGLPVVVTDFPSQAELVRSLDAGLVVPPDDPAAFARAVATLRHNPPSREHMLKVASIIKSEHCWNNRVTELSKILCRIVERGRQ